MKKCISASRSVAVATSISLGKYLNKGGLSGGLSQVSFLSELSSHGKMTYKKSW